MAQTFTPVRYDQSPTVGESPYFGPSPLPVQPRDPLDAKRGLYNRDPGAQYPDGYLSTVYTTRNADKMAEHLWRNQRSYTRGVHHGERVDQSEYLWPDEFNLMSGILNEATTGLRYVSPAMSLAEEQIRLVNDGKPGPRDFALGERSFVPVIPDPARASVLKRLAPSWQ